MSFQFAVLSHTLDYEQHRPDEVCAVCLQLSSLEDTPLINSGELVSVVKPPFIPSTYVEAIDSLVSARHTDIRGPPLFLS